MNKKILNLYFGVPKLTKMLLPIIFLEHVVIAFCLNIAAYFRKINYFNYDLIGQFISTYYFGCLLGALIGGALTLHFYTTKISGIGMLFISVDLYCLLSSSNQWIINLLMFLLGLIGTIVATSNTVSLIRTVKENIKLKVISLELILFNLAFSLVSFILLDLNSKEIFQFMKYFSVILFFAGLSALIFYRNLIFAPLQKKSYNSKSFLPPKKQEFFILISMIFCFGLVFSMVKVVFAPTLIERFGSNAISATIASINPWIIFFIQPLIVNRIKNSNSTWFLGCGGLIVGLSYFTFGMVSSFALTVIVLILLTFGEMMFSPLSKHLNIQLYGEGKEGIASGIWRAVFLGSGILGPVLSGYITEYYGSYIVWECCSLLGLICFTFSFFLKKIKQRTLYNKIILDN
ncbi:multidrug resistance protein, MFS family [Legionella steelei]|uniref:Multidrug resistance protein, MFS family n=1 Tax=Legionella steelei TaxID=947033 RepID=A0A0W0ZLV4_9GAMM|nr:MFS transporter [Legionella steelei]KTD70139.1 multidrug resistance protein, MFS family [Legionella steelei]